MRDFPFLPPYVLAEELTEGRPIVDFHPGVGATDAFVAIGLRGFIVVPPGGRSTEPPEGVSIVHASAGSLPLADDSVGVVLSAGFSLLDEAERDAFLAEARRILGTEGQLIATLPAGAEATLLAPPAERGIDPAELQRVVRRHFPHIALVAQTPFLGYLLRRLAHTGEPGDLVLSSALAAEPDEPVAHLAVCGARYRRFDANHIVQLRYAPFDETIRSRIDELADLAQASRWEATRAHSALEKLKDDTGSLGERAKEAERLGPALDAAEARSRAAEGEMVELRARLVAQERALAAAMGGKAGAAIRAKEAEEAAVLQTASAAREKKRADAAAASLEGAQKDLRDQSERLARLQRALDDREESLALARDERDRFAREKTETERRAIEAARVLETARAAGLDADGRARSSAEEVDALRARLRDADAAREEATARSEAASARLAGLEEELRLARTEVKRVQAEVATLRDEADAERRERALVVERARTMDAAREGELLGALEARDDMIRELRASLESRSASATRLDEEREILRRQVSETRRLLVDAQARAEASEEGVRSLRRRIEEGEKVAAERETLAEAARESETRITALKAEVASRDEMLDRQKGILDGIRHESRDAGKMLATLEAEKETLLTHLSQREDAIGELQGFIDELRKDGERSTQEIERIEKELGATRKRVEASERQIVSMRDAHEWEAASWQGERERLEKEVTTRAARIASLEREIDSARDATRTFQDRAAQLSRETAVLQLEAQRKKASVPPPDDLRGALADEKARAAKAIEESVRKEGILEAYSDAIASSARFRRAVARMLAAAPKPPAPAATEPAKPEPTKTGPAKAPAKAEPAKPAQAPRPKPEPAKIAPTKLEGEPTTRIDGELTRRMEDEKTTPEHHTDDDASSFEEKTKPH